MLKSIESFAEEFIVLFFVFLVSFIVLFQFNFLTCFVLASIFSLYLTIAEKLENSKKEVEKKNEVIPSPVACWDPYCTVCNRTPHEPTQTLEQDNNQPSDNSDQNTNDDYSSGASADRYASRGF